MRANAAKHAALAAALAAAAQWPDMEAVLTALAQQAAAGTRPELLPLMQVRFYMCIASTVPGVFPLSWRSMPSPQEVRPAECHADTRVPSRATAVIANVQCQA